MVIMFIYSVMLLAFPICQLSFLIYFTFSSRLLNMFRLHLQKFYNNITCYDLNIKFWSRRTNRSVVTP